MRPRVSAGASFAEIMRAMAAALIEAIPARARVGAGRLRGLAYALGSDALMANAAGIAAARYAAAVRWWRERFPDETQLPMPAEQLVWVLAALTEGLTYQRLLTPELIPDAVIHASFSALASASPAAAAGAKPP